MDPAAAATRARLLLHDVIDKVTACTAASSATSRLDRLNALMEVLRKEVPLPRSSSSALLLGSGSASHSGSGTMSTVGLLLKMEVMHADKLQSYSFFQRILTVLVQVFHLLARAPGKVGTGLLEYMQSIFWIVEQLDALDRAALICVLVTAKKARAHAEDDLGLGDKLTRLCMDLLFFNVKRGYADIVLHLCGAQAQKLLVKLFSLPSVVATIAMRSETRENEEENVATIVREWVLNHLKEHAEDGDEQQQQQQQQQPQQQQLAGSTTTTTTSTPQQQPHINHGDLLLASLSATAFNVDDETTDLIFGVLYKWFFAMAGNSRRSTTTDARLLQTLRDLLRKRGKQCGPILCAYAKSLSSRMMHLLDDGSLRALAFDVLREIGLCVAEFLSFHGFDAIPATASEWLQDGATPVNDEDIGTILDAKDVYEHVHKFKDFNLVKQVMDSQQRKLLDPAGGRDRVGFVASADELFELPAALESHFNCLADYVFLHPNVFAFGGGSGGILSRLVDLCFPPSLPAASSSSLSVSSSSEHSQASGPHVLANNNTNGNFSNEQTRSYHCLLLHRVLQSHRASIPMLLLLRGGNVARRFLRLVSDRMNELSLETARWNLKSFEVACALRILTLFLCSESDAKSESGAGGCEEFEPSPPPPPSLLHVEDNRAVWKDCADLLVERVIPVTSRNVHLLPLNVVALQTYSAVASRCPPRLVVHSLVRLWDCGDVFRLPQPALAAASAAVNVVPGYVATMLERVVSFVLGKGVVLSGVTVANSDSGNHAPTDGLLFLERCLLKWAVAWGGMATSFAFERDRVACVFGRLACSVLLATNSGSTSMNDGCERQGLLLVDSIQSDSPMRVSREWLAEDHHGDNDDCDGSIRPNNHHLGHHQRKATFEWFESLVEATWLQLQQHPSGMLQLGYFASFVRCHTQGLVRADATLHACVQQATDLLETAFPSLSADDVRRFLSALRMLQQTPCAFTLNEGCATRLRALSLSAFDFTWMSPLGETRATSPSVAANHDNEARDADAEEAREKPPPPSSSSSSKKARMDDELAEDMWVEKPVSRASKVSVPSTTTSSSKPQSAPSFPFAPRESPSPPIPASFDHECMYEFARVRCSTTTSFRLACTAFLSATCTAQTVLQTVALLEERINRVLEWGPGAGLGGNQEEKNGAGGNRKRVAHGYAHVLLALGGELVSCALRYLRSDVLAAAFRGLCTIASAARSDEQVLHFAVRSAWVLSKRARDAPVTDAQDAVVRFLNHNQLFVRRMKKTDSYALRPCAKDGGAFLGTTSAVLLLECIANFARVFGADSAVSNLAERILCESLFHPDTYVRDAASRLVPSILERLGEGVHVNVLHGVCARFDARTIPNVPSILASDGNKPLVSRDEHVEPPQDEEEAEDDDGGERVVANPEVARAEDVRRTNLVCLAELGLRSEDVLLRPVLLRLVLASRCGLRQRRRRLIRRIVEHIGARLGFASSRDLLLAHADYLWEYFLGLCPKPSTTPNPNVLRQFPYDLFFVRDSHELLCLTLPSVLPKLLLMPAKPPRQQTQRLERVQWCVDVLGEGGGVVAAQRLLKEHKGAVLGVLYPIQYMPTTASHDRRKLVKDALTFLDDQLGGAGAKLETDMLQTAVHRALEFLCQDGEAFGMAGKVTPDVVETFLRSIDPPWFTVLNGTDMVMHLSFLAMQARNRPKRVRKVMDTAGRLLAWLGRDVVFAGNGILRAWIHLVLNIVAREAEALSFSSSSTASPSQSRSRRLDSCVEAIRVWFGALQSIPSHHQALFFDEYGFMMMSVWQTVPKWVRHEFEDQDKLEAILHSNQRTKRFSAWAAAPPVDEGETDCTIDGDDLPSLLQHAEWMVASLSATGARSPGGSTVSIASKLSVSQRLSVPVWLSALKWLDRLVDTNWEAFRAWFEQQQTTTTTTTTTTTAHASNMDPPSEIVNALRPVSKVVATAATKSGRATIPAAHHHLLLPRLVSSILTLCSSDIPDEEIRNWAGRCLCKLVMLQQGGGGGLLLSSSSTDLSPSTSPADSLNAFKTHVLEWLYEMLVHENFWLACCASRAVKAILALEDTCVLVDSLPDPIRTMFRKENHWVGSGGETGDAEEDGSPASPEPVEGPVAHAVRAARARCGSYPKNLLPFRPTSPIGTRPKTPPPSAASSSRALGGVVVDSFSGVTWDVRLRSFDDWVCGVTDVMCNDSNAISDPVLRLLGPVCVLEPRFATVVFPWLVFNAVAGGAADGSTPSSSRAIREVSERFREILQESPERTTGKNNNNSTLPIQRLLLSTLSFLRGRHIGTALVTTLAPSASSSTPGATRSAKKRTRTTPLSAEYRGFWLDVDLLVVSRAALRCAMPMTAIMSLELYFEQKRKSLHAEALSLLSTTPAIGANAAAAAAAATTTDGLPEHEQLLLDAYRMAGDRDATYAIRKTSSLRTGVEDRRFEGNWLASAVGYDQLRLTRWAGRSTLDDGGTDGEWVHGEAVSLGRLGLIHAMGSVLEHATFGAEGANKPNSSSHLHELKCQVLWRSMAMGSDAKRWAFAREDHVDVHNDADEAGGGTNHDDHDNNIHHRALLMGLTALADGDAGLLARGTDACGQGLLNTLSQTESSETLTQTLSRLELVYEMQDAFRALHGGGDGGAPLVDRIQTWNARTAPSFCSEEMLAAREGMLRALLKRDGSASPACVLLGHLITTSEFMRARGDAMMAIGALERLGLGGGGMQPPPLAHFQTRQHRVCMDMQFAMACWAGGDVDTALSIAKPLLRLVSPSSSSGGGDAAASQFFPRLQTTSALRFLIGLWLAQSSSAPSRDVCKDWLQAAIDECKECVLQHTSSSSSSSLSSLSSSSTSSRVPTDGRVCFAVPPGKMLGQCHGAMAAYVHAQFKALDARIESPEWNASVQVQKEREGELKALQAHLSGCKVDVERKRLQAILARLRKECDNDRMERDAVYASHKELLTGAMQHYLDALRYGSNSDLPQGIIYRVVHLWFNYRTTCEELNNLIHQFFVGGGGTPASSPLSGRTIPLSVLVPLVYQLVSRISSSTNSTTSQPTHTNKKFNSVLEDVLFQLSCEHPWHTLPHLIGVINSKRLPPEGDAAEGTPPAHNNNNNSSSNDNNSSKIRAARDIIDRVKARGVNWRDACDGLVNLYDAFIALAYHKVEKPKGMDVKEFDANECKAFVRAVRAVAPDKLPMPVSTIPLVPGGGCAVDERLHKIESRFTLTLQGINVPKVVTVVSETGVRRRVLVKGKDDLRQDGVMEQLLLFVSNLLCARSPPSSASASSSPPSPVRLRTYNVLPLTPMAGIIEWVENTTSLGGYLYNGMNHEEYRHSAHARHNAGDISFHEAMQRMGSLDKKTKEEKTAQFVKVLQEFHPAFRHFFFERFGHDPMTWHERRVAYTRSTAANCMVGMILGIGDRHSQNILIDEKTAEVVHIDFGIAFEQGKTLRTPETVPFRLTQDVVDGFGVCGTSGVFTRTCVDTLRVLRENADAILTICEVFVHDPLHKWHVSKSKQHKIDLLGDGDNADSRSRPPPPQGAGVNRNAPAGNEKGEDEDDGKEDEEEDATATGRNLEANRVLNRVRQKLQGYADDGGEPLHVTAQVKRAIQEATDVSNLAQIYHGWGAFL